MVARLFNRFGGDGGKLAVAAPGQAFVQRHVPGIHQVLAGNGVGEAAVWLLHQQDIAELAFVAAKRQRVFIALAFPFRGIGQEIARLAQQVETDIGEREVNFQLRRVAAPGAEALGEHQTVVAQTQGIGSH